MITWEDLAASGPIIQALFRQNFPQGLTREEMRESSLGWVRRALARLEEGENYGTGH